MYARFDETSGNCNRNGSVIRTMGSNSAELYHYGVKGMKWRKRIKKNLDKVNGDYTPSFKDAVVRLQEKRKKYLNDNPVAASKAKVKSVRKAQEKKVKKILDDAKAQAKENTWSNLKTGAKATSASVKLKSNVGKSVDKAKAQARENTFSNLKTGAKTTSASVKLKSNVGKSIDKATSGRKFWTTVISPNEKAKKKKP